MEESGPAHPVHLRLNSPRPKPHTTRNNHTKKQVADALLSDEGSTPEVLFFAAKILQNKIYYDFGELDPRQ